MKMRYLALIATMLLASGALAHGDKKHVIGTIDKISAEAVVVKTADGKSVEVKLAPSTVYVTKDGKPAKLADVAVGDRVVIHATPAGDTLSADEVKFASAAGGSSATPKNH